MPALTPVTTPEVANAILPTAGLLLVHVPPAVVELSEVVDPTHTLIVPVMVAGFGFTVKVAVTLQVPAIT